MFSINEINYFDIKEVTSMMQDNNTVEKRKNVLLKMMDVALANILTDEEIDSLYNRISVLIENKIRALIKEETGQEPIPEKTKVEILVDYYNSAGLKKGDIAEIEECFRFEEDTFKQGWYVYKIKNLPVYPFEFRIIK